MATFLAFCVLITTFCTSVLWVEADKGELRTLKRQKREWIIPPKKLFENVDYTNEKSIAKIRSDEETRENIIYSLLGPAAEDGLFSVGKKDGFVKIHGILDREKISVYELKGRASLRNGSLAERDLDLKILVLDQNDNAPVFKVQVTGSVEELSEEGTHVISITAVDADEQGTPHTEIVYDIIQQEPAGERMFTVVRSSGEIKVKINTLDRETQETYRLIITGTDMKGQKSDPNNRPLTGTGTVIVTVSDVNDNIPILEQSSYVGSVEENIRHVEAVRIKAIDMDKIYTENWEAVFTIISGNEAGYFNITTDRKTNEGILMVTKELNYEELTEVNLKVVVRNKAEYHKSVIEKTQTYPVKINVLNVPEAPHFQPAVKVIYVSEDSKTIDLKKVIATYKATDSDTMLTATNVRYVKGQDINNWVNINDKTAEIRLNKYPDRESEHLINGTYYVTILAITDGKGRELADMMQRRKVDILCVQETRWKGSKARSIGAGFKLFYYGVDSKRNGVGVVLKEEFVRNVLEVKTVSDRVMSLKLEIEGVMLNVVSGYAPQVGCELEEKERFWSELDEVMESIPTAERVVIGADFNGHVGEGNTDDEEVMGKFGVKERNLEGQMVVDFAKRMDMAVVKTYFQKREEHRVTYKSGGRRTQVDYVLYRRGNLKEISDCKVVVGESVARQHRMVVCRMTLMVCKKKRSKIEIEKKTKWWKLKKEECCEEFRQKLRQALGGQVVLPDDWETTAEVIRETGRKLLDLGKAYDKVPREELWYCLRKSGVAEKYVRVVQDMYERSRTVVRCAVGQTEEFKVEVGLHQGSALSPFLFAIVMDQLSEEVRQESPWTMMFADDIVICSKSSEQVEENLERWRFALERRGMKVSRSKTEYMCVNEREGSGTVRLQGEEVQKVQEFKYLGSTVQNNGECGKEVKKRVQAGWNGWRKVSGVLCDRKISARIKGKVCRTVVRPAMLYGLETVSMRKRQESELEVAELKMLRFSLGVTRLDRIRNEYIRGTAHVGRLGEKVREARLRWFGHVQRRESFSPKTATGTVAIQVEDYNDHCPILTSTVTMLCYGSSVVYVSATDGDNLPNAEPFDFILATKGTNEQWKVEHLNATTSILRSQEILWPGHYTVELEVKDQQGKTCEVQKLQVSVCKCTEAQMCIPARLTGKGNVLGAGGVLALLLGILLLLLIPMLLLMCECGGAAAAGRFQAFPFEQKQQLITYHTEGQGEDKELALLPPVPVNVDGGSGRKHGNEWEAHEYWRKYGWKTEEEYLNYLRCIKHPDYVDFKAAGINGHYDFFKKSTFDSMTLSEAFLSEYYATKTWEIMNQEASSNHLLVSGYEDCISVTSSFDDISSYLHEENNLDFLNDLGPQFKRLAEICCGSAIELEVSSTPTPAKTISSSSQVGFKVEGAVDVAHNEATSISASSSSSTTQVTTTNYAENISSKSATSAAAVGQTRLVQRPTVYLSSTPMYLVEQQHQPALLLASGPILGVQERNVVLVEKGATNIAVASQNTIPRLGLQQANTRVMVNPGIGGTLVHGFSGRSEPQGTASGTFRVMESRRVESTEPVHIVQSSSHSSISKSQSMQAKGQSGGSLALGNASGFPSALSMSQNNVHLFSGPNGGTHKEVLEERVSVVEKSFESSSTSTS
ncbi:hypothetical protein QTP86_015085 [Hemibagrus guttatus]|nr:hypothetical protein QTP86_015085 [Hemibagrus guttatus]